MGWSFIVLIIFLCLIICIIAFYKEKNLYNPLAIFMGMWGLIFILYSLGLYNIILVSDRTLFMYLLGLFSFVLGYMVIRVANNKVTNMSECEFLINSKGNFIIILLSVIALLGFVPRLIELIPFWAGGVSTVKMAVAEGYISVSNTSEILYTFISCPVQTVITIIWIGNFIRAKKQNKPIFTVLVFLLLVLRYLCTGSKTILVLPVLIFILLILYNRQLNRKKVKNRKKISVIKKIGISVVGVAIVSFVVFLLEDKTGSVTENIYFYLTGCIPCSEQILTDSSNSLYFGVISLNGFFRLIYVILKNIGLDGNITTFINNAYEVMTVYEKPVYIAQTYKFNAFVSLFSYFYKDGGSIGIILGSFSFGAFLKMKYQNLIENGNAYNITSYLLWCYFLFTSVVRFQLFLIPNALAIIYLYLMLKHDKPKTRRKFWGSKCQV